MAISISSVGVQDNGTFRLAESCVKKEESEDREIYLSVCAETSNCSPCEMVVKQVKDVKKNDCTRS